MSFIRCVSTLTGEVSMIPYHRIAKILDEHRPDCTTCILTLDGVLLLCADANWNTKDVKLKDSIITFGCGCKCSQEDDNG